MQSPLPEDSDPAPEAACRLILNGRVQGLGVRPTIYLLATELQLAGTVQNTARGVEIDIEGDHERLDQFHARLPKELPRGSVIERLERQEIPPVGHPSFSIVDEPTEGPLSARVPVDMSVCKDCLAEVRDPEDRRYRYPFTSCTACGPRYTIIHQMPYERHDITMSSFVFCPACRTEYERPGDRRFHAQTDACAQCGPHVWAVDANRQLLGRGEDAIQAAVRALRRGHIVALRGLGGYQLLVDATDEDAVRRLRTRKRRRGKPLAVMVKSLDDAARWACLQAGESEALSRRANPIVLVRSRPDRQLAPSVHPGFNSVGLMLPTTPLHAMVADGVDRPLVCTSGNREGDPLEFDVGDAERHLTDVCDLWLHHNRPIARPIDDSVVRVMGGRVVTVRLARGLAPLALNLPDVPPALALGGYLKSAVAWSNGVQSVLGPHVGDQETLASRQRYLDACEEWQRLYRFEPKRLVHDDHPDYFSTVWAKQQPVATQSVQHHYAHVLAGMLEHHWLDRTVMGVAWDGTGYGSDGTIWGGEFLIANTGTFERFARLRPFRMPGGERVIHEPWRAALAVVEDALGREVFARLPWVAGNPRARSVLNVIDRPQFSPTTSSAGRLFDAVAALVLGTTGELGGSTEKTDSSARTGTQRVGGLFENPLHADLCRFESRFDGHPAMMLEAIADPHAEGAYDLPLVRGTPLELDWRPLIAGLLQDAAAGVGPSTLAMRFHRSLAQGIIRVCQERPDLPIVLVGGVFQNRLLTELLMEQGAGREQMLGLPGVIPPNDGGLAAGQLVAAAASKELR